MSNSDQKSDPRSKLDWVKVPRRNRVSERVTDGGHESQRRHDVLSSKGWRNLASSTAPPDGGGASGGVQETLPLFVVVSVVAANCYSSRRRCRSRCCSSCGPNGRSSPAHTIIWTAGSVARHWPSGGGRLSYGPSRSAPPLDGEYDLAGHDAQNDAGEELNAEHHRNQHQ
jgi:hypothetical protein